VSAEPTTAVLHPVPDRRQLMPTPAPRHLPVIDPLPDQAVPVRLDPRIGAGGKHCGA